MDKSLLQQRIDKLFAEYDERQLDVAEASKCAEQAQLVLTMTHDRCMAVGERLMDLIAVRDSK